jgi:dTDP-glucose pyrophosphorylase
MWGIVPAAGTGSRIQPLAFSKELLPVGSRSEGGVERPRAVSEYLLERMVAAGVTRVCFVVSAGKSDIVEYYGASFGGARIAYVVQPEPVGLCDAVLQAVPLIADDDPVVVGLPDTVWFPADALCSLGGADLELLLFRVDRPELFDAVTVDADGRVVEIEVKKRGARTRNIWGAFKTTGRTLRELGALFVRRERRDPYLGTLFNAWIAAGGHATATMADGDYVDVGTIDGYRQAIRLLERHPDGAAGRDRGLLGSSASSADPPAPRTVPLR